MRGQPSRVASELESELACVGSPTADLGNECEATPTSGPIVSGLGGYREQLSPWESPPGRLGV